MHWRGLQGGSSVYYYPGFLALHFECHAGSRVLALGAKPYQPVNPAPVCHWRNPRPCSKNAGCPSTCAVTNHCIPVAPRTDVAHAVRCWGCGGVFESLVVAACASCCCCCHYAAVAASVSRSIMGSSHALVGNALRYDKLAGEGSL
jgi:hypothetical protein